MVKYGKYFLVTAPCGSTSRGLAAGQLQDDRPGRRLQRRPANVGKGMEEVGKPVLHRGGFELAHHRLPAFAPLFDAHVQRQRQLPRHTVDIVWIDQDRRIEFFRRAGWDVWDLHPSTPADLLGVVRKQWFSLIGVSLSCESRCDELPPLMAALRKTSRNASVALMGVGQPFIAPDER